MNFFINVNFNKISPYAICFILSFVISFIIASRIMIKQGINKTLALLVPMANCMCALYGGLLYTMIVSKQVGFSSIGGLFGLLLGNCVLGEIFKESKAIIWTAYCVVIPLLYSISKVGCFLVGCCYGICYDGFLSVTYNGDAPLIGVALFPVQLIETIVFFGIFLLSYFLICMKQFRYGISICLVLSALAKFVLEFFRAANQENLLGVNQIFCLVVVFGVLFLEIYRHFVKNKVLL